MSSSESISESTQTGQHVDGSSPLDSQSKQHSEASNSYLIQADPLERVKALRQPNVNAVKLRDDLFMDKLDISPGIMTDWIPPGMRRREISRINLPILNRLKRRRNAKEVGELITGKLVEHAIIHRKHLKVADDKGIYKPHISTRHTVSATIKTLAGPPFNHFGFSREAIDTILATDNDELESATAEKATDAYHNRSWSRELEPQNIKGLREEFVRTAVSKGIEQETAAKIVRRGGVYYIEPELMAAYLGISVDKWIKQRKGVKYFVPPQEIERLSLLLMLDDATLDTLAKLKIPKS